MSSQKKESVRRHFPAALFVALVGVNALVALAHDWPSPDSRRASPAHSVGQGQRPPHRHDAIWPGMLWAGPQAGPPQAPQAGHCARPPQRFEVPASPGYDGQATRERRLSGTRRADGAPAAALAAGPRDERAAVDGAAVGGSSGGAVGGAESAAVAKSARREGDAVSDIAAREAAAAPARNSALPRPAAPASLQSATPPLAQLAPPSQRADVPVTAGVVDDNADFGEYLAYRKRSAHLVKRELSVDVRVLLDVRDARGRAVPDAQVSVFAAGHALPLWARTDAGGRAWLQMQPGERGGEIRPYDMAYDPAFDPRYGAGYRHRGEIYEVQVSKDGALASALWQRGQKHTLQVRLDTAQPPQPARLDIAFVIDATGSMADEILKLKRSMRAVADQIAMLPTRPDTCFALVAYRDRGDEFFVRGADFSNDLGAFQQVLEQLRAAAGGDYPEAMNEALHTAVHRLSWRGDGTARMIVLLADAPPHLDYGAPHYDNDLRGALARGIKVFSIGASGLDAQGEYIMRQAAQFTGGRFVFLTYADARNPSSGPGRETVHDVRNYSVETLDKLVVRLVGEEMARWPGA